MKKYFKFVSSILTATILISILYPNMALAKTALTQDNTTTPYYDNILSSPQKNLFKNITYDNLTMTIEDKFLKENSGTIYRKSEQEYLINLGEIKSSFPIMKTPEPTLDVVLPLQAISLLVILDIFTVLLLIL